MPWNDGGERGALVLLDETAPSSAHTSPGSTRFSPGCWKWVLYPSAIGLAIQWIGSALALTRTSDVRRKSAYEPTA